MCNFSAYPQTLDEYPNRKSLLEGKRASERLKAVNHQMEEAASQGIATGDLQE